MADFEYYIAVRDFSSDYFGNIPALDSAIALVNRDGNGKPMYLACTVNDMCQVLTSRVSNKSRYQFQTRSIANGYQTVRYWAAYKVIDSIRYPGDDEWLPVVGVINQSTSRLAYVERGPLSARQQEERSTRAALERIKRLLEQLEEKDDLSEYYNGAPAGRLTGPEPQDPERLDLRGLNFNIMSPIIKERSETKLEPEEEDKSHRPQRRRFIKD